MVSSQDLKGDRMSSAERGGPPFYPKHLSPDLDRKPERVAASLLCCAGSCMLAHPSVLTATPGVDTIFPERRARTEN